MAAANSVGKGKRKPAIDWERARRLYRVGQLTDKEISEVVGCAPRTLYNRASKEGWTRDLTTQVAEETRAVLSNSDSGDDADMVANAAQQAANVVRRHRDQLVVGRQLIESMFAEMGEAGRIPGDIEEALRDGLAGKDVDIGLIVSAYSVGARAKTMNMLAQALTRLIQAERTAWNLDEQRAEKPFEKMLREIAGDDAKADT